MNLRILLVASVLLALFPACERKVSSDFVVLAQRAYPEGKDPDHQALDDLWSSLFRLQQWHFLAAPGSPNQPAVQTIANEGWLLVFTDPEKLKVYQRSKKATSDAGTDLFAGSSGDDAGTSSLISMPTDAALALLAGNTNPAVTGGVRFNEGSGRGWFSSLKAVGDIRAYLWKAGKLDPKN